MTASYAPSQYLADRSAIVQANGGSGFISLWNFVPQIPLGPKAPEAVAALAAPTRFLAFLWGELATQGEALGLRRLEPEIEVQGFLGSGGERMDPWLLLPIMGTWLHSGAEVRRAAAELNEAIEFWGVPRFHGPVESRVPRDIGFLLPHAQVPNPRFCDWFLMEAAERIGEAASDDSSLSASTLGVRLVEPDISDTTILRPDKCDHVWVMRRSHATARIAIYWRPDTRSAAHSVGAYDLDLEMLHSHGFVPLHRTAEGCLAVGVMHFGDNVFAIQAEAGSPALRLPVRRGFSLGSGRRPKQSENATSRQVGGGDDTSGVT